MKPQKPAELDPTALRRRAEERLRLREGDLSGLTELDLRKLVHELQVHQIELELQGEELRAARTETESSLARYTDLFDFAPIGYLTLFTDETIREMNHAAAALLGRHRSRLIGQKFGDFLLEADHRKLTGSIAQALQLEQRQSCEVSLKKLGAPTLVLRLTVSPRARVEPMILLALEDVTELRAAEQRKDEFLAALSHELRNPLTPLRNSLALLKRAGPGSEPAGRAQAIMDRQLTHLTRLVDDLLDVTRIARGKVQLHRARVELGELARQAVDDQRLSFELAGVALETHFEPGPFWVDGDPDRLSQVLVNLLTNAEKFTPRGGRVVVVLAKSGEQVRLSVRDNGVGIAPELLRHMFEPFAQAPQTMDRSRGGLGLGLAMARGLLELHGGTVDVTSEGEGRGAEVTLFLPLGPAQEPPVMEAAARPSGPRRVLIIEDNRDAADSLRDALLVNGHQVDVAYSGPTGLELARAFHPEIVLCDVGLPGMDGYGVARAFRADPALRAIRLVALTGYAMPDDLERARAAGFDQHLTKPPTLERLERLIADAPVLTVAEGRS